MLHHHSALSNTATSHVLLNTITTSQSQLHHHQNNFTQLQPSPSPSPLPLVKSHLSSPSSKTPTLIILDDDPTSTQTCHDVAAILTVSDSILAQLQAEVNGTRPVTIVNAVTDEDVDVVVAALLRASETRNWFLFSTGVAGHRFHPTRVG